MMATCGRDRRRGRGRGAASGRRIGDEELHGPPQIGIGGRLAAVARHFEGEAQLVLDEASILLRSAPICGLRDTSDMISTQSAHCSRGSSTM